MDPSEAFAYFFDFADVLASTLDPKTGTLTVQLGDVAKNFAEARGAELWQGAPGVASRPALPTAGKAACQAIICKDAKRSMVIATRDLRATSIYANLEPGATCVYATSGQARSIYKAAGSARQYTTDDNKPTGNAVFAGVASLYQGTDGHTHPGGEWRVYAPWGGQWQDPSGYHLRTWHGVKVDAGGLVMPAPFNKTVSKYRVSADLVSLDGSVVALGRGTPQALVQAAPLQAIMATLATSLGTVQSQLGVAAGGLSSGATGATLPSLVAGNNTAAAALTAAATALAAAITALGTVATAAATKTVTGA